MKTSSSWGARGQRAGWIAAWLAGVALCAAAPAAAQEYPNRTIRLVSPEGIGSMGDVLARRFSEQLSRQMGVHVEPEPRAGGDGSIGADSVAKAPPDGYTLLLGTDRTQATNVHERKLFPYDPVKDFTPIAALVEAPFVLLANRDLPVKDVPELLAYAKTAKLSYACIDNSSSVRLAAALLATLANISMTPVCAANLPKAIDSVAANQAQLLFLSGATAKAFAMKRELKVLGVAAAQPLPDFGDAQPIAKAVPGYRFGLWYGVFGPARLPPEIVTRLNAEFNKALAEPAITRGLSLTQLGGTPLVLQAMVEEELVQRERAVRAAGIEPK